MATAWTPMTRMEPRRWLLANGEIVTEPALEMTPTGRKVRVAGTLDSVYHNELEALLDRAANTLAAQRATHVWMEMPKDMAADLRSEAGLAPEDMNRAKLHLIHEPTNTDAKTVCYWRFKAPDSPFEALLVATMEPARGLTTQRVVIRLCLPYARAEYNSQPFTVSVLTDRFTEFIEKALSRHDNFYSWSEHLRDNEPGWPTDQFAKTNHSYARPAVTQLLRAIQAFEALDSITVPDLSDLDNPAYATLELYDTNVNAELLSDLAEYLDGAPTIEQVAVLYQQMLDTLRSVGINVGEKSENDFMAALLAGDKETLNVQVFALADEERDVDHNHRLAVHLPSGTFVVECDHANVDRNAVAEKWEEALTMASLTGQETELLAYAKAYAGDRIKRRTTTILKERTKPV